MLMPRVRSTSIYEVSHRLKAQQHKCAHDDLHVGLVPHVPSFELHFGFWLVSIAHELQDSEIK